jgi:hypothetical protein
MTKINAMFQTIPIRIPRFGFCDFGFIGPRLFGGSKSASGQAQ